VDELAKRPLKPLLEVSEMQSGRGGLGHCWSALMNLAAVPEIDRWSVSTTWSPGLTPSLTSTSGPEVAHVGNLGAMHHAVLDR
jgi:hypothetical protein